MNKAISCAHDLLDIYHMCVGEIFIGKLQISVKLVGKVYSNK